MTDGSSDDMGGSLLRMLDPDETYALNYADGEDYDMDLKHVKGKNDATANSCQTTKEEVEPLMLLIMIRF